MVYKALLVALALPALGIAQDQRRDPAATEFFHGIGPSDVIVRDVAIIGGGSAGTYTAVRLGDFNKSVVVVEEKDTLGGHTETYHDPATGKTIDFGVFIARNYSIVFDYFSRFNISLSPLDNLQGGTTVYVDPHTGQQAPNYSDPNPAAALAQYAAQAAKYPYLEEGFDLPYPVPEDLLLTFSKWAIKYGMQDAVHFIYRFAEGLGDILNQPVIYVLKNFGLQLLEQLNGGLFTTTNQNNHALYEAALAHLGDNVLLKSRVKLMGRDINGISLILVSTPEGLKLIKAKKVVLAIPPNLYNLHGWDLSAQERKLFAQFRNSGYYTGLLRNTGLPAGVTVDSISLDRPFNIPALPAPYQFSPSAVDGIFNIKYGAPANDVLPSAQVKADILATLKRIRAPNLPTTPDPEFVIFSNHNPFENTVPVEAIRAGFYKELIALQGVRSTWYTGATFHTHDSGFIVS